LYDESEKELLKQTNAQAVSLKAIDIAKASLKISQIEEMNKLKGYDAASSKFVENADKISELT
jgi:hypothetical protein